MREYYLILAIFILFVNCELRHQPGNLKDLPTLDINHDKVLFKTLQDSLLNSSDDSPLVEVAREEVELIRTSIGSDNRFVLYFDANPNEFFVIQPLKQESKFIYLVNGSYIDTDGYVVMWDADELSKKELMRIKSRVESLW